MQKKYFTSIYLKQFFSIRQAILQVIFDHILLIGEGTADIYCRKII